MVTSAPRQRVAVLAVTAALLSVGTLSGAAWADEPTPTPAPATAGPAAAQPDTAAPADVQPTAGTWIIGGTLQAGAQAVTAPVAKPVAQPATKPVAQPAARPGTTVVPAGDATVLPFTGPGHVELLLPLALLLLGSGVVLTVAGRPRAATA